MNESFIPLSQHILTTTTLTKQGYSDSRILQESRAKKLLRLRKGIYVRSDFWNRQTPWDKHLLHIAGMWKIRPTSVFSHTSAAAIYGLPVPYNHPVHIYVPRTSGGAIRDVKIHQRQEIPTFHLDEKIMCTDLVRTVQDCARILDFSAAVALADGALQRFPQQEAELRQTLQETRGRNSRKARGVAQVMSALSESPGESYTRVILNEMELKYTEQVEIVVEGKRYRCDFMLDNYPIIIEFDGRLKLTDFGATDTVLEKERSREKDLQNAGWYVFRVGWELVHRRPDEFRVQLARFIRTISTNHR